MAQCESRNDQVVAIIGWEKQLAKILGRFIYIKKKKIITPLLNLESGPRLPAYKFLELTFQEPDIIR